MSDKTRYVKKVYTSKSEEPECSNCDNFDSNYCSKCGCHNNYKNYKRTVLEEININDYRRSIYK